MHLENGGFGTLDLELKYRRADGFYIRIQLKDSRIVDIGAMRMMIWCNEWNPRSEHCINERAITSIIQKNNSECNF